MKKYMTLKEFAESIQNTPHSYPRDVAISDFKIVQEVCLKLTQALIALQKREEMNETLEKF